MRGAERGRQFHGRSSSIRWAGCSAIRARTSASQACGSTSFILAVTIRLYIAAARCPPRSEPGWLAARPEGRFQFVFTPKHGSWLNLVEGFFAKAARSVLRHIRVGSTHELKQRIIEFIDDLNRDPVIHRWQYQIDATA